MAHTRDASWDTDLIWHYFKTVSTKANPGSYSQYYRNQDSGGELSDRARVYEMLVDEPEHTLPTLMPTTKESLDNYGKSKLPWNQNNGGFLTSVNQQYWCGSIIKMVFVRYMGWPMKEPDDQRYPGKKGSDAVQWTIDKLKKNIPVRASLGGQHYVGIVGHRVTTVAPPHGVAGPVDLFNEFLCIDPWAYGTKGDNLHMKYAGAATAFLGISKQAGSSWTYGQPGKIVQWVETPK